MDFAFVDSNILFAAFSLPVVGPRIPRNRDLSQARPRPSRPSLSFLAQAKLPGIVYCIALASHVVFPITVFFLSFIPADINAV